jgi:hypothetical protein
VKPSAACAPPVARGRRRQGGDCGGAGAAGEKGSTQRRLRPACCQGEAKTGRRLWWSWSSCCLMARWPVRDGA